MKKIAATIGFLSVLWAGLTIFPTVAQNPQFPQTLPPNTVVGRTGINSGPAQAIPFQILTNNLISTGFAPNSIQNGVLANMAGGTVKCKPAGASTGSPQDCSYPVITVTDAPYSAACDGVTNDAAAIQSAINALPFGNGTVLFPSGKTCKINSGLAIGNGTSSSLSTFNGTNLSCAGIPVSTALFGSQALSSGCKILWGGTTGVVINVGGPLQGWGISNLIIDCQSQAGTTGLRLQSAQNGYIVNTAWNNCAQAMNTFTVPQFGAPANDTNTENNTFINTVITMPNITSSGVILSGQATDITSNTHANNFINLNVYVPGTATTFNPIVLQDADSNVFFDLTIFGGGAGCTAIQFAYTDHNIWPASNTFYSVDPGTNLCTSSFQNSGTPGASKPNYIYGLEEVNQAVAPLLANLAVYSSHNIVMAPAGNVTPTDLMGAWVATYTPTPTCGSATITTNAARSKTQGKTTFVELDVTITALGTCTNAFTFTLPNTVNSGAGLAGRQTAGSGANVNCYLVSGSASATCASSANLSANQIVLSGVYENQ